MPIAHAEGRYITDAQGLAELQANDQILFRYCTPEGELYSDNGAMDNIAGICNAGRNVFGMMPHPERASEAILGNTDGLVLFQSLYNAVPQPAGA
jgi:phosphoribosylformylglycinamidine synthase